jgi:hypothetical protein
MRRDAGETAALGVSDRQDEGETKVSRSTPPSSGDRLGLTDETEVRECKHYLVSELWIGLL